MYNNNLTDTFGGQSKGRKNRIGLLKTKNTI